MTLDTFASDRIIQTVVSRYKNKTNNNNNSNHLQLVFGLNHNKNNLREFSQICRTLFNKTCNRDCGLCRGRADQSSSAYNTFHSTAHSWYTISRDITSVKLIMWLHAASTSIHISLFQRIVSLLHSKYIHEML